jgi:hypothetical protein
MNSRTFIVRFALFTLISINCSELSVSGNGGSSETVNAKVIITDTVVTLINDSGSSSGLAMEVFSTNYRPYEKNGFTAKVETGKTSGALALPSDGIYNFLIYSEELNLSCFIRNKAVQEGSRDTTACVLSSKCMVDGKLVSKNEKVIDKRYIISVQGTPFIGISDESRGFTLGAIPRGSFTLTVRPKDQRLFIANTNYEFKIDEIIEKAQLDIVLP